MRAGVPAIDSGANPFGTGPFPQSLFMLHPAIHLFDCASMIGYLRAAFLLAKNIDYNREWFAPDQDHLQSIHSTNEI